MGPGMTSQLQENDFIREIFGLGTKLNQSNGATKTKASKLERVSILSSYYLKKKCIRSRKINIFFL